MYRREVNMQGRRWIGALVAILIIAAGAWLWFVLKPAPSISTTTTAPAPATTSKLRIGLTRYTGDLPFFVAIENNYFKKRGLEPVVTEFADSSEALNALIAGNIDVVNPISFSALLALEAKSPGELRLFLAGGENDEIVGSYLLVMKSSPYEALQDLKGKKIGTYTGATQLLYLKLFLERAGIDPERDVEIVQVGFNLQLQALEAGQFDALFTIEPTGTIALSKDNVRLLVSNPRVKYIVNPFLSGAAAFRKGFVADQPDVVGRVLLATDDGLTFIRQNETTARSILAKYTALDPNLAKTAPLLLWYGSSDRLDIAPIQKLADLLADNKLLARRVDVAPLFINEAEWKR